MRQSISSTHFLVLVNGYTCGFFRDTNGLRQGDPLSPSLFFLMVESLGRNIKKNCMMGFCKGVGVHRDLEPISHSQFVDDTILFWEASDQEVVVIKETLDEYVEASSQIMNKNKSQVFLVNTSQRNQNKIEKILEFQTESFPSIYLGVPLFIDRSNRLL